MRNDIPPGVWFYMKNLPASTTEESLSEYFRVRGLDIPPESISVKVFDDSSFREATAGAMVSMSKDVVLTMVKWVLNDEPVEGRQLRIELSRAR